jgi:hypothetical protein
MNEEKRFDLLVVKLYSERSGCGGAERGSQEEKMWNEMTCFVWSCSRMKKTSFLADSLDCLKLKGYLMRLHDASD